jgi:hypothetical protein
MRRMRQGSTYWQRINHQWYLIIILYRLTSSKPSTTVPQQAGIILLSIPKLSLRSQKTKKIMD